MRTIGVYSRDPLSACLPFDHASDYVIKPPDDFARSDKEFEGLPFPGAIEDGVIIKPSSVVDLQDRAVAA